MSEIRFTKDHEWIAVDGDTGVVGITDYAQHALGDIVFIELPEIGRQVSKGGEAAVVESVKAASEVYAPVDGDVIAVNNELAEEPARVNADAEGAGWFFKIKIVTPAQLAELMDKAAYQTYLEGLA